MAPPKSFNDRYLVISLLGEGGVGKVFRVHDTLLDKEFALKILHKESSELAIARFQKEAKAAGKLKHSNICNIFDFGLNSDGQHYMVMELLKGKSLAEVISDGPLQSDYATEIVKQICLGLDFAHKNGVIHRDLKPANVQILNEEKDSVQLKLLDFGMAGLVNTDGKLTQTGALVGTPAYMSPELIVGESAGIQSDIYSLGCLWFEMITGHPPFRGNSVIETLSMHKNEEVPPIDDDVEISPALKSLLYRCLSKEKNNRPKNIEEILNLMYPPTVPNQVSELTKNPTSNKKKITALPIVLSTLGLLSILIPIILISRHVMSESATKSQSKFVTESKSNSELEKHEGMLDISRKKEDIFLKIEVDIDKSGYKTIKPTKNQTIEDDEIPLLQNEGENCLILRNSDSLTGSGFKNFKDKNIDTLDLVDTDFEDQNIIYLKNLNNLKNLDIYSPKLTDAALPNLAQLKGLENLDLGSGKITDDGLRYLGNLTNLKKLTLRCDQMTFDWLNDVSLPELKELLLEKITPTGSIKPGLPQFPKLKFLKLSSREVIDDKTIKALETTKIKYLYLEEEEISDQQMLSISKISTLKSVLLSKSKFSARGIDSLSTLKNLEELGMKQNQNLNDEIIEAIAKLNLTQLDFSGSNITDSQLSILLNNTKLERLLLRDCNTSQERKSWFKLAFQSKWKKECKIK